MSSLITMTMWCPSYPASFNPDHLPVDELPMVEDERSEFNDRLDKDHDGTLDYQEIKAWLVPDDVEFFQEEARHLIAHADKDEVRLVELAGVAMCTYVCWHRMGC